MTVFPPWTHAKARWRGGAPRLNWNVALETGGWLVGDTMKIEISAEGYKQA